ncbi:DUF4397 domain-containing protein [Niabella sp. CC-SYL272]|uniref:DUF4397 domain-containing protein n=1 Tax=Niabella agricola TaxID=2891571 RepID=UPI001F2B86B9|nr:DUF4397 domain-containing protein [Niabella agricola]MCF3109290.1 DUF4397 domain-containing protein [Niabella agricola]
MKYFKFFGISLAVFLGALASCKKNTFSETERSSPEGKALVKFGFFSMYPTSTPLTVYQNNTKLSVSAASPYGYPGGGFNTGGNSYADYLAIDPGNVKFDVAIVYPNINFVQRWIYDTTMLLGANKKYTILMADTAVSTTSLLLEDDFPAVLDSGYALFRIGNLIPNSGSLDFYKNDSLIASNVAYKSTTPLIKLPASLADTFAIRPAGAPSGPAITATAYYRLATNTNKRIYTMVSRGYLGSTTPRNPTISLIINK